ncbi:hypothetical protein TWF281_008520 [Arthrobotrys megalospora]
MTNTPTDPTSAGFDEVLLGVNALVERVGRSLVLPSEGGTKKLQYEFSGTAKLSLESDWKLMEGLVLKQITLKTDCNVSDKSTVEISVELEAKALIGEAQFTVKAKVPSLRAGREVQLSLFLGADYPINVDQVVKDLQSITKDNRLPSSIIDSQMQTALNSPVSGTLQILCSKPASQDSGFFTFRSLLLTVTSNLVYETKLSSFSLRLSQGRFYFGLRKIGTSYDVLAQLRGQVYVNSTSIDAGLDFTLEQGKGIVTEIEIGVSKIPLSTSNGISMADLLTVGGVFSPTSEQQLNNKKIVNDIQVPQQLSLFKTQLSKSQLDLTLYAKLNTSTLEVLDIRASGGDLLTLSAPILGGLKIRDLAFAVRKDEKGVSSYFIGSVQIDAQALSMIFDVEMVFDSGKVQLKGILRPECVYSLPHLAAIDVFNPQAGKVTNIVPYAKENPVGGDSGLTLLAAAMPQSGMESVCSFDVSFKPSSGGQASPGILDLSGFVADRVQFVAQYGLKWTIIPDKLVLNDLGARFDITDVKDDKLKQTAGFIYGHWKLTKYDLWVYILGSKTAAATNFRAGLTVKSGSGQSENLLGILQDSGFIGSGFRFPDWYLSTEVKAKPNEQQLIRGLVTSSALVAQFTKPAGGSAFKMQQLEANVNLTADFNIFESQAVVNGRLLFRAIDPLSSSRSFETFLQGSVNIDAKFYLTVTANLSIPRAIPPPTVEESLLISNIPANEIVLPLTTDPNDIDITANAFMLSSNAPSSVSTLFDSSLIGGNRSSALANLKVPVDYPVQTSTLSASTTFSLTLKVAKKPGQADNSRYIKSLIVRITTESSKSWPILGTTVSLEKATLCLYLDAPQINQSRQPQLFLDGVLRIGQSLAAVCQVSYVDSITRVRTALTISPKDIIGAIDPQPTKVSSLAKEDIQSAVLLYASFEIQNSAVLTYKLAASSIGKVQVFGNVVTLKDARLAMTADVVNGKRSVGLFGYISFGSGPDALDFGASVTWTTGAPLVIEGSFNVTLESLVKRIMGTGLDSIDKSRPPLNDGMGFGGWDKDIVPSSSWAAAAGLIFEETLPSGRTLKKITVTYTNNNITLWVLITNYLWLSAMSLNAALEVPENRLTLGAKSNINMKKRSDIANQQPWIVEINIAITSTTFTFSVAIPETMDTTDIVFALTAGIIEVPRAFAIPIFRNISTTLDWSANKRIIIEGLFLKNGTSWQIPKLFGRSILEMKRPALRGTINISGVTTAAASLHGFMKLFNAIDAEVEFVLPKGPLKIGGYNITDIINVVTYLWQLLRRPPSPGAPAPATAAEAAEAIGAFVSSVAAVNTALGMLDIAGVTIASGLLGGALWLAMKAAIITRIVELETNSADKAAAESKARDGLNTNEDTSVSKSDPKLDLPGLPPQNRAILLNGDFESGNTNGWEIVVESASSSYQLVSPGFTGSYRLLNRVASGSTRKPASPYSGILLRQTLATSSTPATKYNFEIRFKFLAWANDCYLNCFINGQYILSPRSNNAALAGQVQTGRAVFTSAGPSTLLEIWSLCCAGQSMNFEIDSISVSPVLITQ